MKRILWLTEWFPTPFHPYSGDSIERLAKAVSLYNDITILFVKKKPNLAFPIIEKEVRTYTEHCRAVIYYYPIYQKWGGVFDLIVSNYFYLYLHWKAIRECRKKYGKPDGVQVNVAMKNGVVALFLKWYWKVRYVVMERWGGFLPEAKPHFRDGSFLSKMVTKRLFQKASLVVTPSSHLANILKQEFGPLPVTVVPNVVDGNIFHPGPKNADEPAFQFIHISSLDYPKDFESVIQATKMLIDKGYSVQLKVFGPYRSNLINLVESLGLEAVVIFCAEASQDILASAMRESRALILYSRYETFGNVIIEANAVGIPVIVSDYPTFSENVLEGKTGLVAQGNHPGSLAEKMIFLIEHFAVFDPVEIRRQTLEKYGYEAIGKRWDVLYQECFT